MVIGLLGHGTIGVGVDHIAAKIPGMKVKKILSLIVDSEMEGRTAEGIDDICNDPEIDTVVEVMGGVHPAYEFLSQAAKAGKNIVTANKAVVAAYYKELNALCKEHGVSFRATASVGGGIPWLTSIEKAKHTDCIENISGIMNGTTNYILSSMEAGLNPDGTPNENAVSFAEVLKEAQDLGYAEKDPTSDIDGLDVRRKITISANVAYDTVLDEETVPTFGIRPIEVSDFQEAFKLDSTIRLIAEAEKVGDNRVSLFVIPQFVKKSSLEANVLKNFNLFKLNGTFSGELKFYGQGAGRYPTANNVVSDLADIMAGHRSWYTDCFEDGTVSLTDKECAFYVRTVASLDDLPAHVSSVLASGALITEPVSTKKMIAWAEKARQKDAGFFIAKVTE